MTPLIHLYVDGPIRNDLCFDCGWGKDWLHKLRH